MSIKFPLIKLPSNIELTLYLIREELKSRKLFHALQQAGPNDCYFEPHLIDLILKSIDLDNVSDETFGTCTTILDKRSKKIESNNDSVMKQAMKVYCELMEEKKKLQKECAYKKSDSA